MPFRDLWLKLLIPFEHLFSEMPVDYVLGDKKRDGKGYHGQHLPAEYEHYAQGAERVTGHEQTGQGRMRP